MTMISVIMPVFNTPEEWLRQSVESILNQTYSDFEFLIIDDGSTNNAPKILAEYAAKDARIKIIPGEHKGISNALNRGLERASGKFIARMDSDDIASPCRFEKQIEYFEKNPEISICGTEIKVFPNGKIINYPEKAGFFDLLKICCLCHPTVMIKTDDLKKYNLKYNENFQCSEDYDLWSRAIQYLNIGNVKEVLLNYRLNPNGNSKNKKTHYYDSIIRKRIMNYITKDEKVQKFLYKYAEKQERKKLKFYTYFFFAGNIWQDTQKVKVIKVLGITVYKKILKINQ